MNKNIITEKDKKFIANTYKRQDLVIASGLGSIVKDIDGKSYIDFGGGIAVSSFGISDPKWVEAITAQAMKLSHTSNLYYSEPMINLAELIITLTGMSKVFFSNSGAEANECAIKCARKYSNDKYGKERTEIITLTGSFHGRTMATLSATGQDAFHNDFNPFLEGFIYANPNDISDMNKKVSNKTLAIMIELVQGEGGVNVLDKAYVKDIESICKSNDILLIIDEVQTGNGRCGSLYAYTQYDILPDIITTAKGFAGGLPMGATLMGEKVKDTLSIGKHGSTFGGNPICAAGAYSIISRIDDDLLADVKQKSELIKSSLATCKNTVEVTGLGLMLGIKTSKPCADILARCLLRGLIVLTAKDKIRLLPALNIDNNLLKEGMQILCEVIDE